MSAESDFLVKRDDLRECRIADAEPPGIEAGQALLRVDTFGLTANNITYAVLGELMSYWDFFPAEPGWGRVPMWGFAEVLQSEADGVEAGTRLYGYLPPSSHLLVTPDRVSEAGFADASPHRAELPAAYQRLNATGADPFYDEGTEEAQMLLRPLFLTSFLIDDQLDEDGLIERGPIVISSASSKTALGVAHLLAQRDDAEVIGLTSPRNADFVEGLGVYDRTVTYEAIDALEPGPATFVDLAGDGDVRHAFHSRYGDDLVRSLTVGASHWDKLDAGAGDLPGPQPAFFFAPDRVVKRAADWGPAGLQDRAAGAWAPFCEWAAGWLEIDRGTGFEAVRRAYLEVLDGGVEPRRAHVLAL